MNFYRIDVIRDGQQRGVDFRLTDAELTLPLAALRTRVLDPARSAFVRGWPEAAADYDAEEAKLIESLGLVDG